MTTQIYHDICSYLRRLIEGTPYEGHLFAVGGCCRDEVMGNDIKDVDLAVDLPDGGIEFAQWLHSRNLTEGEPVLFPKFGTAKFQLRQFPGDELQVVQTRREKYTDRNSRCPETAFGSLREDCMRRDLTINSLYYDISRQNLIDLTGLGVKHIHDHVLQTPTDPFETFDDDPVRILRCVRFGARFGWPVDGQIHKAMTANAKRLDIISRPRLMGEFAKLLTGPRPAEALRQLRNTGALCHVMPQISSLKRLPGATQAKTDKDSTHTPTVWHHTLDTVAALENNPDLALRLAALLHEAGKTQTKTRHADGSVTYGQYETKSARLARQMLRNLHFDSPTVREVLFLITHHTAADTWGDRAERMKDKDLRRLQLLAGTPQRFEKLLALIDARNHASARAPHQAEAIRRRTARMMADGTDMFSFTLPLTPDDVMRIKNTRNDRLVRRTMQHLMKMACLNPARNDYENLVRRFR